MRIAYVSTDPGITFGTAKGAAVHVAEMVGALAEEGAAVLALVADVAGDFAPRAGVSVARLPMAAKGSSAAQRLAADERLGEWLMAQLAEFAPTAIYERFALYTRAGSTAARALGVPHAVELNAPLLQEAARYRTLAEPEAAARLEADVLAGADVVFAVSPPLRDHAVFRGTRRVEVLQNAAAVHRFPGRGYRERPLAVFAGSLRPWHGLETIREAWRLLGDEAPPLLVIGDGPSGAALDGVGATLVGAVEPARVPAVLASADIGLAPYGSDTPTYFSPIKLFEYLAAGLATVVGDLPAVRQVVDDDTAVVIPPGDPSALAEGVARLAADTAARRRLGRNGRRLAERRHTWRHRARRVLDAVSQLAASRASIAGGGGR